VFQRLSVFPAPFTLEAAQVVVRADAADVVPGLVERSLLAAPRQGPDGRSRFSMLDTLRAYGAGRLAEAGEASDAQAALAARAVGDAGRAILGSARRRRPNGTLRRGLTWSTTTSARRRTFARCG
jgi:hypothetical protein